MKFRRPFTRVAIFFLIFFVASCIGLMLIKDSAAAAPQKKEAATKPPIAESKPVAAKPVEAKPEELKSAKGEISEMPAVASANWNTVGCILPLSGRFADTGAKALDAVLLSSETFNQRYSVPWKIVVADSGETEAGMRNAINYLADQAKAIAIVAVAGSQEAEIAAVEAEKRKVPLILITSREGVTEGRHYVFQHFLTPTQQMQALAGYALENLNVALFAVLYPQDEYGEEMLRLFRREIQKKGGKITKALAYHKSQTDYSEQISKLLGQKAETSKKSYATDQDTKSRTYVDFEALFIPDSSLRVKMVAAQLAFHDVKGIRILGTSQWHSADLLKKGAEYLDGSVFADSFLANGFLPETNDFVEIYYAAYNREPETIDALSFDTMDMVLGILEENKGKSREDFIAALSTMNRFQGATGSVHFQGSHVAQKTAFIIRIQKEKLEQVK